MDVWVYVSVVVWICFIRKEGPGKLWNLWEWMILLIFLLPLFFMPPLLLFVGLVLLLLSISMFIRIPICFWYLSFFISMACLVILMRCLFGIFNQATSFYFLVHFFKEQRLLELLDPWLSIWFLISLWYLSEQIWHQLLQKMRFPFSKQLPCA